LFGKNKGVMKMNAIDLAIDLAVDHLMVSLTQDQWKDLGIILGIELNNNPVKKFKILNRLRELEELKEEIGILKAGNKILRSIIDGVSR